MKNSKNDITSIDNDTTAFGDLPTAEEADRMLAEADEAAAVFDETAVTNLALAEMQSAAAKTPGRITRTRRKALRAALVAACIAVLLFGTFVAAAHVIYDVRFTQLIGLEGTMTELEKGYFQIELSKTIDDLTVTVVDAIGDARIQWVEIRTNRKLADGTPDGWLEQAVTDDGLYINTPALPDAYAATGYLVKYYEGSLLSTVFSDIDCTEHYRTHLKGDPGMDMSGSLIPFCRDGYLWYMMQTSCDEDINRSFTHLEISFNTAESDDVIFEFNWCNNYKSDETTFRVNKSVGSSKVKKVVLTGASMFLYTNGGYNDIRLDSVKLEDGTVLYAKQSENEVAPGKSGTYTFTDDGRLGCSGSADDDGFFTSSTVEYSLLPGVTFQTPPSMTSLIPMDEIVSITVNDVEINLK